MSGQVLDEISLPAPVRDGTTRDVWSRSLLAARASIITGPGLIIVVLLGLFVGIGYIVELVNTAVTVGLSLARVTIITAFTLAAALFLGAVIWAATLVSDLHATLSRTQRRIVDDHCAITIVERHRAGKLPTWEIGSLYAYPQRQGHGRRFQDALLTAAIPVAFPAGQEPRVDITVNVAVPKVLALYRAALEPHHLQLQPQGRNWYGGTRYKIIPAAD